jgi:integrase
MLTDTAIRNAKPRERPYRLGDSRGLYLLVTPSGGKWWRFDYRFGGKRKSLSTGTYPDVALKEARGRRDSSREHLAHGGHRCAGRSPVMETHYAAMTDPKAMGALLRAIDGYRGDLPTRCALRAGAAYVRSTRRAAPCGMERVRSGPGRVEYRRMKTREPHLVPLSRQAVECLRELYPLTGRWRYVFPGVRSAARLLPTWPSGGT